MALCQTNFPGRQQGAKRSVNIKDKGMNGKYVLNRKYAIRIPTRQEKKMAPKIFNNHSVLEHKYKNTEYIISNEISDFLKSFRKPNSLETVIKRYHRAI